jgi:hypothetical protein
MTRRRNFRGNPAVPWQFDAPETLGSVQNSRRSESCKTSSVILATRADNAPTLFPTKLWSDERVFSRKRRAPLKRSIAIEEKRVACRLRVDLHNQYSKFRSGSVSILAQLLLSDNCGKPLICCKFLDQVLKP